MKSLAVMQCFVISSGEALGRFESPTCLHDHPWDLRIINETFLGYPHPYIHRLIGYQAVDNCTLTRRLSSPKIHRFKRHISFFHLLMSFFRTVAGHTGLGSAACLPELHTVYICDNKNIFGHCSDHKM